MHSELIQALSSLIKESKRKDQSKGDWNLQSAIEVGEAIIAKSSKQVDDAFKEAALPLIKYLCENHHPHVAVIVTPTDAQLMEGVKSTGEILDFIKD